MKLLTITVSGRVQGVFFRASTREKAETLGLKGFVRNEPNGHVYIEAEGPEDALDQFKAWCRQGPPMAQVNEITIHEAPVKNYPDFTIHR